MKLRRLSLIFDLLVWAICTCSGFVFASPSAVQSKNEQPSGPHPRLLSVRLVPQDATLWGAKASQHFLVLGKFGDGLERDVTLQSRFSVSHPQFARVDASGRVTALASGETALKAEVNGLAAKTSIRMEGTGEERPFSFARDVGGVLTKRGCNGSECHGGVKGQAGFKLSVDALYPREDYKWIVKGGTFQVLSAESGGPENPRINIREAEKSLLLQKATFAIPHGGGKRLNSDSSDYQTLLKWIRNGAPYGKESEQENVRIERIELFPKEGVLERTGKHQMLVTAFLSNGRREDLTDEVAYVSNNPDVVTVGSGGLIQAEATGETAVMVRAAGHAVSARFGVIAEPRPNYPQIPRFNFIDDFIFAKLRKFNIIPSELSSDSQFLRRVCLDLTGTLPPPNRVREFLASKDPRKRDKLIDILLQSPEYVDYWTFRIAELFRASSVGTGAPEHGYVYWQWIRESIAQNKPYDQLARERIGAQGFEGPSRHYLPYGEEPRPEDIMPEEMRVFMGRRLDCAQCHNHPFESWSQDQFWGMAAFFGRLNRTEWSGFGATVMFDDPAGRDPDYGEPAESAKVMHPRTKAEVRPAFLDGKTLSAQECADSRKLLSEWITSHPYFAEAAVNRIWSYLLGRGIVDPVDDFRSTNPPTHPDLLASLARDFREHGYDLKRFLGQIVRSRTYQLSSIPNETNKDDRINYSHFIPRLMDGEVLLDAVSDVTGVPEVFKDSPESMAPLGTRAIQLKLPDLYPSRFLTMYGRPNRERVPERKGAPNLAQALHMLVGSTYTERLSKEGSRLNRLLKSGASDRDLVEELYLVTLARFPTAEEHAGLEALLSQRSSRDETLQDLFWALITSREFSENH